MTDERFWNCNCNTTKHILNVSLNASLRCFKTSLNYNNQLLDLKKQLLTDSAFWIDSQWSSPYKCSREKSINFRIIRKKSKPKKFRFFLLQCLRKCNKRHTIPSSRCQIRTWAAQSSHHHPRTTSTRNASPSMTSQSSMTSQEFVTSQKSTTTFRSTVRRRRRPISSNQRLCRRRVNRAWPWRGPILSNVQLLCPGKTFITIQLSFFNPFYNHIKHTK